MRVSVQCSIAVYNIVLLRFPLKTYLPDGGGRNEIVTYASLPSLVITTPPHFSSLYMCVCKRVHIMYVRILYVHAYGYTKKTQRKSQTRPTIRGRGQIILINTRMDALCIYFLFTFQLHNA